MISLQSYLHQLWNWLTPRQEGSLISSLNNFDQEGSSVFVFFLQFQAFHCVNCMPLYDHLFETNFVANRDCVTHFGSGLAIGQPLQTNKTRCDKKCLWHLIVWCSYAIIINCLMFKWKIQSTNPCAKKKCWLDSGADRSFFLQQPTLVHSPGIP